MIHWLRFRSQMTSMMAERLCGLRGWTGRKQVYCVLHIGAQLSQVMQSLGRYRHSTEPKTQRNPKRWELPPYQTLLGCHVRKRVPLCPHYHQEHLQPPENGKSQCRYRGQSPKAVTAERQGTGQDLVKACLQL